ncbi:MerR family DNA-binding transcriptional regulator [Hydrogenophilus islandicus]
MEQRNYTIGDLAREFAITPRTIRYYEEHGILNPRREGRQRVYTRGDRTRLKLALRGKRLGLSLAQIKELLDMYDGMHNSPTQIREFLRVLAERRATLEQQRRDIEAVLAEIDQLEAQCHAALAEEAGREKARQPV